LAPAVIGADPAGAGIDCGAGDQACRRGEFLGHLTLLANVAAIKHYTRFLFKIGAFPIINAPCRGEHNITVLVVPGNPV
jgi:hypothetical protein